MLDQLRGRRASPARGPNTRESWRNTLVAELGASTDAASLAVFRIGFGTIIAWEVWRAFDGNLIRADYDLPTFHFTWWLFDWVKPLPGVGIYIAFGVLGVAAVLVALGAFYRFAAALTCVGIAYWFLMEKASYLNHRYLAALFAFVFVIIPAHAAFSIHARRGKPPRSVAAWTVWLMRFQVGAPYFFAGIAKLNFDWLVRAEPLRAALERQADFPLLGRFFDNAVLAHVLAWGSTALDLFVPFLLLHRRTRVPAFGFALAFHFINARLFEIGIFPWTMIVGTTIFFDADWPRRMAASLRSGGRTLRAATIAAFAVGFVIGGFLPDSFAVLRASVGGFGVAILVFHALPERLRAGGVTLSAPATAPAQPSFSRPLATIVVVCVVVQLLLPLRHYAIPGNVHWTEDGSRFAWHMLLRSTKASVAFRVTDRASGRTWTEDLSQHLTAYQIGKLRLPDTILQFAHHLEDHYRRRGMNDVEVRVRARATLNGRPPQRFIRPKVDLTRIPRPYVPPEDWVVPLRPYHKRSAAER